MADECDEGRLWQTGVWDRMAEIYERDIDTRFGPVIDGLLSRANLKTGETVVDLGTGTGAVAISAARSLGPEGRIIAVDISTEMLEKARRRAQALSVPNVTFGEGRAEEIPVETGRADAVLASLSMMYVIDRAQAAHEIARVLRPGGRFVAAVWGGPEETDIVLFQETAGRFAPAPPVGGVGPGALADPASFLSQLRVAGLAADCESEVTTFQFANLDEAWDPLAGVTCAALTPELQERAKAEVQERMWPDPASPRVFHNTTLYITAHRPD